MATFYLDPVGGNDANAGTSFALRWKTFTTGATAARIAPGDTIRIMASPLPSSVGNATWTNGSPTVTLASAVTKTVDDCNSAWTASANVTCSTDASNLKQGTASASFAIASGFTTGLVAYKALGSTEDFSAYQQISFWIRMNAASISASVFKICLCSDAAGATPVDTFILPALSISTNWHALTIDKGSALGSSIQSVALYADSDPGTVTLLLDNIFAVKATSSADSLSLTSMIGKGDKRDGWYPVDSVSGTTIRLGMSGNAGLASQKNYLGTTETVTTYKRESFIMDAVAASTTVLNSITDSGSAGSLITYSGGWNRTDMSTQLTGEDGMSFFSCVNSVGVAFEMQSTKSYIHLENLGAFRIQDGLNATGGPGFLRLTNFAVIGCNGIAMNSSNRYGFIADGVYSFHNSNSPTFGSNGDVIIKNGYFVSTFGNQCLSVSTTRFRGDTLLCKNSSFYGLQLAGVGGDSFVSNLTTSNSPTAGINFTGIQCAMYNALVSEATEVNFQTSALGGQAYVYSQKHDQTADNQVIFADGGRIASDTTNRRTASGICWKFSPTSVDRHEYMPLRLRLAQIACVASSLVTAKVWVKRDNTGITAKLVCIGGQIAGVATDVVTTAAGVAGSYEELTITFTPTEAGVVEIEAQVYGGTTYNAYFDDMTISQA